MREALRDIAPIAARDIERNFELYELSFPAVVDGLKDPAVMALSPPTAPRGAVRSRGQRKISRGNARSRCKRRYRSWLW